MALVRMRSGAVISATWISFFVQANCLNDLHKRHFDLANRAHPRLHSRLCLKDVVFGGGNFKNIQPVRLKKQCHVALKLQVS